MTPVKMVIVKCEKVPMRKLAASCDGETVKSNANPRKLAVLMRLESGGVYCVEN